VAPDGTLLLAGKHGYLYRATKAANGSYTLQPNPLYIGPGRPLGVHVEKSGAAVIVCDSVKGLVRVQLDTGTITVLTNRVTVGLAGATAATDRRAHINYANDLDVADDGTVFFTSSTEGSVAEDPDGYYNTMRSFILNMCRGDHTGRLLRYSPATGQTEVLMDGLWYANGVAVAPGGASVLVVETMGFRVLEFHLSGPKAGQTTTLIDKLPGFPDGITRSADGNFYISLCTPPSPLLPMLGYGRTVRTVLGWVTTSPMLQFLVKHMGGVVKMTPRGDVVWALMDRTGANVFTTSAVTEHDGHLFLGNLNGDFVSRVNLAAATASP